MFNLKSKFIYFLRRCNFELQQKLKFTEKTEKESCKSENSVYGW